MQQILFILIAIGLVVVSRYELRHADEVEFTKVLLPPPPSIRHFTFGYAPVTADFLWLRAIQDFDYCESTDEDLRCREGWLFQMLDTVTDLSPDLRLAYSLGATSLSVLVDDIEGASQLFDKGVAQFPEDWIISYRAAYHYLYETHKHERAAELMLQAAKNGAPPWTYSLAARLYTKEGKKELGHRVLNDLERSGAPPEVVEKMREKIDQAPIIAKPKLDESE